MLTPKQIVTELDRYIIGQEKAKKAVAVALRNRYRRKKLNPDFANEITPKNIILQGSTGVGKTEIARRLAKIVKAPFIKVEATKFTEVGYVGRDVESMVRDLVSASFALVKKEKLEASREIAKKRVDNLLVKIVLKQHPELIAEAQSEEENTEKDKKVISDLLNSGKIDDKYIEVELPTKRAPKIGTINGSEIDVSAFFGNAREERKKRTVTIAQARESLIEMESDKLVDEDLIAEEAIERAEMDGIIFIDEIDKIAEKSSVKGSSVSREGVQRDILPIIEGSIVKTNYGLIKTDHILFIAAGAFHVASVKDLIPELQGRFPVVVKLNSLTESDFIEILKTSDNALLKQYTLLLEVDKVSLKFTDTAIKEIAKIAACENETSEDIGARRLHTILELLLEDISFNASGDYDMVDVVIDKKFVNKTLDSTIKKQDLKKYIL